MSGERRVATVDEHLSDRLSLTLIRPTDLTEPALDDAPVSDHLEAPRDPAKGGAEALQRRSRASEAFGRQMGSIFREPQVKSGGRR